MHTHTWIYTYRTHVLHHRIRVKKLPRRQALSRTRDHCGQETICADGPGNCTCYWPILVYLNEFLYLYCLHAHDRSAAILEAPCDVVPPATLTRAAQWRSALSYKPLNDGVLSHTSHPMTECSGHSPRLTSSRKTSRSCAVWLLPSKCPLQVNYNILGCLANCGHDMELRDVHASLPVRRFLVSYTLPCLLDADSQLKVDSSLLSLGQNLLLAAVGKTWTLRHSSSDQSRSVTIDFGCENSK
jgi:hypothetical protein